MSYIDTSIMQAFTHVIQTFTHVKLLHFRHGNTYTSVISHTNIYTYQHLYILATEHSHICHTNTYTSVITFTHICVKNILNKNLKCSNYNLNSQNSDENVFI